MNTRRTILAAALALSAFAVAPAHAEDKPTEIRIGTQKGGLFPAVRQRHTVEDAFKPLGIEVKWIDFQFGPPLLEAINVGSVDFGYVGDAPPIFAQAANAKIRYAAAVKQNGSSQAIIVPKDSPIKTLADLKGKSLSVGAPKSGTELNSRAILAAAGMSYKDLGKVEYLPFAESVDLMKNRQLNATLQSAGLGVASLKDLSTSSEINVVAVPKETVDKIGSPFVSVIIPANTYTGQDKDVPTAAVVNYLVTSSAVSDDLAYQMTKLVYESLPELANAHAAGKEIKLEAAATGSPVPLHPGAIRFYKEKGLIK